MEERKIMVSGTTHQCRFETDILKTYHFERFGRHASQAEWMWPKLNVERWTFVPAGGRTKKNQIFSSPSKCSFLSCKMDLAEYWIRLEFLAVLCHTTTGRLPKFVHPVPCHTPGQTVRNGTVFGIETPTVFPKLLETRLAGNTSNKVIQASEQKQRGISNR